MPGFLLGDCPGASANVRSAFLPYVHLPLTTHGILIVMAQTLPGESHTYRSEVSPSVYLLVAGPIRPIPLGTITAVLRLKTPVGSGLVKVKYIQPGFFIET